MVRQSDSKGRGVRVSGPAGIVGGGSEYTALSSTFNTTTEVPLSKAPNPQLLPRRRSINSCPLLWVYVHGVCVCVCVCVSTLDGINAEHKFRVWVTILGHMSRHFHFQIGSTDNKREIGATSRSSGHLYTPW